jgi:predicted nuclease with RNAse H fold
VHYCGVVPAHGLLQLAMLEEVRTADPPIHLSALFFEPGSASQLAEELRALGDLVVALGAPLSGPGDGRPPRDCDELLQRLGVSPQPPHAEMRQLGELLEAPVFRPGGEASEGPVAEGAYSDFPAFETNAEAVFCAMQGRRLPAKRHPLGVQRRIEELQEDRVVDDGGELWHRRIEEIDAVAAALCAHRYAVGHACWLGNPDEGVVVLPGSSLPEEFPMRGVLPPVERLHLPQAQRQA